MTSLGHNELNLACLTGMGKLFACCQYFQENLHSHKTHHSMPVRVTYSMTVVSIVNKIVGTNSIFDYFLWKSWYYSRLDVSYKMFLSDFQNFAFLNAGHGLNDNFGKVLLLDSQIYLPWTIRQ